MNTVMVTYTKSIIVFVRKIHVNNIELVIVKFLYSCHIHQLYRHITERGASLVFEEIKVHSIHSDLESVRLYKQHDLESLSSAKRH